MKVTIRDIARECGCSVAPVSYVLNNGPRPVAPELRQRIEEAIQRLGYHPSDAARSLNQVRRRCLGVLFPDPHTSIQANPFFAGFIDGMMRQAAAEGQDILLFTGLAWESGERTLPVIRARGVDGLILVAPRTDTDLVASVAGAGFPAVVLGAEVEGLSGVSVDNRAAVESVTRHVAALGHRSLCFVPGAPNAPSTAGRAEGFAEAVSACGVGVHAVPEGLWRDAYAYPPGSPGVGHDRAWGKAIIASLPTDVTAVVCGNDLIALGVMDALRERGRVPGRDVAVTGFDDIPQAGDAWTPLTTVRQPLDSLGAEAVRLLLERITTPGAEPVSRRLPTELMVRASTVPPPQPTPPTTPYPIPEPALDRR